MTTILAASAVVLFAVLIGIIVFFFFVYQYEELKNRNDKVEATTGPYRPYTDVSSTHPDSCVYVKPFPDYTSKYQPNFEKASKKIQDRLLDDVDYLEDKVNLNYREHYEITKRIEKLERLVRHLYLEHDEDMNEIENSVIDPYFKNKFKNDKQLDTNEDNIE